MYIILLIAMLGYPLTSRADMSSASYRVFGDSIGASSGDTTSSAYSLNQSFADQSAGNTTSSSYIVRGGAMGMDQGSLSLTLSSASVSLGTLSTSAVSSGSTVVTITSNSDSGYTLSVGAVNGAMHGTVADGAVSTGSNEYGVAISGTDQVFSTDAAVAAGLVLASASSPATNRQTTVTFKAAASSNSTAGSYSQTVTLTVSANF